MIDGVRALIDAEKALRTEEPVRPVAAAAELPGLEDTMPDLLFSSTTINVAIPAITPKI
jgi:hypothetical protein